MTSIAVGAHTKIYTLIIPQKGALMDDIADNLIKRFISKLKVAIAEVFESFNIELALPLILNSE